MFDSYVFEKVGAEHSSRLLLFDVDRLEEKMHYCELFAKHGFKIIYYKDDLDFRVNHGDCLTDSTSKFVVIAHPDDYVPYDIRIKFKTYNVSLTELFPKLNTCVIKEDLFIDYDLLSTAYSHNYEDLRKAEQTQMFCAEQLTSYETVQEHIDELLQRINNQIFDAKTYQDWCRIAEQKAEVDVLSAKKKNDISTAYINNSFQNFIMSGFGSLSSEISKETPVMVSKAMEFMHEQSAKFAVIVMDGMSEFDWYILKDSFKEYKYAQSGVFAMIPSTTSVSRQCLLSNKYPRQLLEPWKLSKEKTEFVTCALELGFSREQVAYEHGYDADFPLSVQCAAVIINDIDDMVHSQKQGRQGMYNDVSLLSNEGKLKDLALRLLRSGFDVYITSDHGNTPCTGMGKLVKTGVEVETKSRRMLVLKDFADITVFTQQKDVFEYPKYYLDKTYDYLICAAGRSFDAKDQEVMSHGGVTIDEVIVPFITLKAVDYNA